jgi:hypothetical protein
MNVSMPSPGTPSDFNHVCPAVNVVFPDSTVSEALKSFDDVLDHLRQVFFRSDCKSDVLEFKTGDGKHMRYQPCKFKAHTGASADRANRTPTVAAVDWHIDDMHAVDTDDAPEPMTVHYEISQQ